MPSAGEVEQFAYCAHNWWLARGGVDSATPGSKRGIEEHAKGGQAIASAEVDKKEYRQALGWAFRLLGMAASVTVLTLEVLFLRSSPLHYLFLTLALVLVASSGGLLVIAFTVQETYRNKQQEGHIIPGHVVDSDLAGEGTMLEDPALHLTGKPDYVLQTAHGLVPVEFKTGQTPDRPFESHALQLASYLHLLESTNGAPPEYGLLTYPKGTFRIGWDDDLRARLKATLERMAAAEAAGKADRDHEQPGRCRGCARRSACDQRLA